jgi:hypothetical protein
VNVSYTWVLMALKRVERTYVKNDFAICNIEYNVEKGVLGRTYSVKGTAYNPGSLGFFALAHDILSDIRFIPCKSVHLGSWHPRGFLYAGECLAQRIAYECTPNDSISLEGHSLGAAACLIAGAILKKQGYKVECIVTFGAPRVGKLPDLKGVEVFSFKNGLDFVTTVPFGFGRSEELIHIGKKGMRPVRDHMLKHYEKSLIEKATTEKYD